MWMMGYNDGGGDLNFASDSFNGRKLRPLIPRPLSSLSTSSSNTINPTLNLIQTNDFFSQFHHMAAVTDQSKRELSNVPSPPMVVSSRWNPTPEQLRLLEELYRRGTRTPSADQIQHITAQLRRFGKIEGKNVFYWFQNHKARERQKRRRQMESVDHSTLDIEILDRRDPGSGRTVYEVEQTKNWPPSTNCTTLLEESGPIQQAAKASIIQQAENGWVELQELHQIRNNNNFGEKNSNNNNNITVSFDQLVHCSAGGGGGKQPMMNTAPVSTAATVTTTSTMHQKLGFVYGGYTQINGVDEELEGGESSETLQLFPLCSDTIRNVEINIEGKNGISETVESSGMNSANLTPLHFFEFLPLKN